MNQEGHIFDYAIIGKRLFEDTALRSADPVTYFEDRAGGIFGRPDRLVQSPVLRDCVGLIMKWPLGSKPDASGDVLFDMSSSAPTHWIERLPMAVSAMRHYYCDVGVYLGCVRNATLRQIRHVMHYVLDECAFGFVGLDAAGLIGPEDGSGKPNPNWGKVLWIENMCQRASVPVYYEPVTLVDLLVGESTLPGGSIQEEDCTRPRFGLANVISKPDGRALPPAHRVIAAQMSFNAKHFDTRLDQGYRIAANFSNPEVRAWFAGRPVA